MDKYLEFPSSIIITYIWFWKIYGDCIIILRNILRKPECTPKQLNRLVRDGPWRHGVNAAILNEKKTQCESPPFLMMFSRWICSSFGYQTECIEVWQYSVILICTYCISNFCVSSVGWGHPKLSLEGVKDVLLLLPDSV